MGYVAVQGGVTAIENAEALAEYLRLRGSSPPLEVQQIQEQLPLLVDRVMSEGGLYSAFHAALALKQSLGDPIEASFYIRAYRSTLRRMTDSLPIQIERMRLERRISSAFKNIPGGQILGPTPDYRQRILNFTLAAESAADQERARSEFEGELCAGDGEGMEPERFRKVVAILREQGLVPPLEPTGPESNGADPAPTTDVTRESITFPADRSGRLQMLARAETGGVLALAYSSMRGFGDIHPTIAELRVGWVEVRIPHPYRRGESVSLGSLRLTEVEIVASVQRRRGRKPTFSLGYGACFGHNELKAISMAVLDRTTKSATPRAPAEDQEFVLLHTDGIEASGFCSHFKLPHYITFQSALDRLRESQRASENPEAPRAAMDSEEDL